MNNMFYGCDNLMILDISNFDAIKCDLYNNMFSYYTNLKYIDLKNLKNDKILTGNFNNTKLFYVCQSMNLIRNSYAINCCVYDIENDECDYIPFIPTTTIFESTIIDENSLQIESTQYTLNNQFNESTENLLITEINEITESNSIIEIKNATIQITTTRNIDQTALTPQINESIIQISNTELIKSINTYIKNDTIKVYITETIEEKEQTETIFKTQTDIKTEYQPITHNIDYLTNKIDTTDNPTVHPETIYHPSNTTEYITSKVSLLGFSHFNKAQSYFSFCIYFVAIINNIFSKTLNFPVIIDYNRNMRIYKQVKVNCTLNDIISIKIYKYLCEVNGDTTNIKSIGISPDFNFISQNNNLIGISPYANLFMDNLQLIDEKYNELFNKTIYIFDNSNISNNDTLEFNISGIIEGTQPEIKNKNISITTNLKEQKPIKEIDCIINNKNFDNYLLNCKANESLIIDLQSAISFINNDDLLIFNFYNNSVLATKNKEENINNRNNPISKNQSGELTPGLIVAIIIISIFILASTIFAVLCFRKKNIKNQNNLESSAIKELKTI
jgi:hypothetical protein